MPASYDEPSAPRMIASGAGCAMLGGTLPPMKTSFKVFTVLALTGAFFTSARAADIDGKWRAEFESQIGQQKYVFELKADGEKLSGKASFERQNQKGET